MFHAKKAAAINARGVSPVGMVLGTSCLAISLILLVCFARTVLLSIKYSRTVIAADLAALAVNGLLADAAAQKTTPSAAALAKDIDQLYPGAVVMLAESNGAVVESYGQCTSITTGPGPRLDPEELASLDGPFYSYLDTTVTAPCTERARFLSGAVVQYLDVRRYLIVFTAQTADRTDILPFLFKYGVPWFLPAILLPSAVGSLLYIGWRRFRKDVQDISQIARKYAAGDMTQRSDPKVLKELDIVASVFNDMAAEVRGRFQFLESDDQQRKEMLHALVHDLRTPFASMRSALLLLKEHTKDSVRISRYRSVITTSISSLRHLGAGLEFLSHEHAAEAAFRAGKFDVGQLIEQLSLEFSPAAEKKGVTLITRAHHTNSTMLADRTLVYRALANLLANALRFAPRGTVIELISGGDAETVLLTVTDQGRGIDAGDIETIFRSFVRLSNPENQTAAGAGLGLSFVKRVAELHGGEVYVESPESSGSAFTLRLPARTLSRSLTSEEAQATESMPSIPVHQVRRLTTLDSLAAWLEVIGGIVLSVSARTVPASLLGILVLGLSGILLLRRSARFAILSVLAQRPRYREMLLLVTVVAATRPENAGAALFCLGALAAIKSFLLLSKKRAVDWFLIACLLISVPLWQIKGMVYIGFIAALIICLTATFLDSVDLGRRLGFRVVGFIFVVFSFAWLYQILGSLLLFRHIFQEDVGTLAQRALQSELLSETATAAKRNELDEYYLKLNELNPLLSMQAVDADRHLLLPSRPELGAREIAELTWILIQPYTQSEAILPDILRQKVGTGSIYRRALCPRDSGEANCSTRLALGVIGPTSGAGRLSARVFERELASTAFLTIVLSLGFLVTGAFFISTLVGKPFSALVETMRAFREGRFKDPPKIRGSADLVELGDALTSLMTNVESLNTAVSQRVEDRKRFTATLGEVLLDSTEVLSEELCEVLLEGGNQLTEHSRSFSAGVEQMMRREKLMDVLLLMFTRQSENNAAKGYHFSVDDLLFESEDGVTAAIPGCHLEVRYLEQDVRLFGDLELLLDTLQLVLREGVRDNRSLTLYPRLESETVWLDLAFTPAISPDLLAKRDFQRLSFLLEILESVVSLQGGRSLRRYSKEAPQELHQISLGFPPESGNSNSRLLQGCGNTSARKHT